MPILLPHDLTPEQIRVLQEYRRLNTEVLTPESVSAIRHPAGGGESPAAALVEKGFLVRNDEGYQLTDRAREFLAIEATPEVAETNAAAASAAANPQADGV